MKLHLVFVAIAAIVLAVALFAPQSEARIPRRKLQAIKKLGLAAILLKGKKKFLLPIPLPLPLPMPIVQKIPVHEPIAIAEPVAVAKPVAYPEPLPSYSEPAPAYPSLPAYGGDAYESADSYAAEPAAAPAYPAY